MGAKDSFFTRKHDWSVFKDEILEAYLKPYLAKIAWTRKPVIIADCFAGKGRFDDGQAGSPLLILDAVDQQLKTTPEVRIKSIFIEKKYFSDLEANVGVRDNAYLLKGSYEDHMEFFLKEYDARQQNLLLYVDPYGIKSIRFTYFKAISSMDFNSVEVLLNLNARGFLREGCRLLKDSCLGFGDIDAGNYEPDVSSPESLDEIAGGDYWGDIIDRYYQNLIDMHQAEEEFVSNYCAKLESVFKYVINTPIKEKMHHIPKYRMVYGTNHPDGLLLMVDNMNKRWKAFRDKSLCGQTVLMECDLPDFSKFEEIRAVRERVLDCINKKTDLKSLLVCLIGKYGIAFSVSELINIIREMENDKVQVTRVPAINDAGKPINRLGLQGKDVYSLRRKEIRMSTGSAIEWTESTWNPVTGCTKISAGCKNCYAERMAKRLQAMKQPNYRNGFKLTCHEHVLELPLKWKKPQTIFVNSMSDLFHKDVPTEFILKVFDVMIHAKQHRFQVLTKRAGRLAKLSSKLPWSENIWMGVTVENQDVVDRVDHLRKTGAHIKFLSIEPLIGPITNIDLTGIDWAIVGGESGPGARKMEEDWVLDVYQQCRSQKVPFFFKQWGGVNKKAAGRELKGKTYSEMPRKSFA